MTKHSLQKRFAFAAGVSLLAVGSSSAVLNFADQTVTGGGAGITIANNAAIVGEVGQNVDDTLNGVINFAFTLTVDSGGGANTFNGFQQWRSGGEGLSIGGDWGPAVWGGFYANGQGAPNATVSLPDTYTQAAGQTESFSVSINYVAGGTDTATVTWDGQSNTPGQSVILTGDYGFDELRTRAGNAGTQLTFTNMSMTLVPEPSSSVVLLLSGCLVALRRRRK